MNHVDILRRSINPKTGGLITVLDPPNPSFEYSIEGAVPLEVAPGSIVLLHGNFLHYSE
jgi:hypothetical protein